MSEGTDSVEAQLEAIRRNFVEQLSLRVDNLQAAFSAWRHDNDPDQLAELHRLAHSLTGAGATFGYTQLSKVARDLEAFLKSLREGDTKITKKHFKKADALLEIVKTEIASTQGMASTMAEGACVNMPVVRDQRLIYLLDNQQNALTAQLKNFDYHAQSFESGVELSAAVEQQRPALIIASVSLSSGKMAGIEAIARLQRRQLVPIPVVFVSSDSGFDVRLEAVRAWGMAYLCTPFSTEALLDVMNTLLRKEIEEPYRVMVVDDQDDQARHHSLCLQQAGMVTRAVTDSMEVFECLRDFAPELILMDMYMPQCHGLELAAVIRQQPEYVGVPIVFLSTDHDREAQLEAIRVGGDDFLSKPIKTSDLIESVTIRAERYRALSSLISRDSLTGLLNHTHIMLSLEQELARAERYGGSLSYAIIDIDHLKKVNESYGYGAGDHVLKSLSRLLQQRLRKSDIIGRYSGEEFAVIMLETSHDAAVRVIDEIRQTFSHVEHRVGDAMFYVTLSCGVVSSPPLQSIVAARETADQLMHQAKRNGCNCVVGEMDILPSQQMSRNPSL